MSRYIENEYNKESCFNCNRSVKWGSGYFVDRIPSCDDYKTRCESGYKYPLGAYCCSECDTASNEVCPIYDEPTLPDENGDCSLCGQHVI